MTLDLLLSTPINVTNKGQLVEVEVINISLPTVQYYAQYVKVKECVMTSMLEMEKKINTTSISSVEDANDDDDKFPLEMFLGAGTVMELSKAINAYLVKCAKFDDIAVTDNNLKKLSITDYNNILERVSYFLYEN